MDDYGGLSVPRRALQARAPGGERATPSVCTDLPPGVVVPQPALNIAALQHASYRRDSAGSRSRASMPRSHSTEHVAQCLPAQLQGKNTGKRRPLHAHTRRLPAAHAAPAIVYPLKQSPAAARTAVAQRQLEEPDAGRHVGCVDHSKAGAPTLLVADHDFSPDEPNAECPGW